MANKPSIVVIGGGITGLSAAWSLSAADVDVTCLESSSAFGGKIKTSSFAGVPVEEGADAFLARTPWAKDLTDELDLQTVAPNTSRAWIWSRGKLEQFPSDTLLGIPSELGSMKHISTIGKLRAVADVVLPKSVGRKSFDPSVAELIGKRLGHEMLDRMVDPLLGGINAGDVSALSVKSVAPQIDEIASTNRSLLLAARKHRQNRAPKDTGKPVFLTTIGGLGNLISTLVESLAERGVSLDTNATVAKIRQLPNNQWSVELEDDRTLVADGVIIATPSFVTRKLIQELSTLAAELLSNIEYSSVSIVRLAYKKQQVTNPLNGSGFVVPVTDGHVLTACSWTSSKWAHSSSANTVIFRASAGRANDTRHLQMSDEELAHKLSEEVAEALGIEGRPLETDVIRWESAFPQYRVGHSSLVGNLDRAIGDLGRIRLAGAAYRGLGVPSCVYDGAVAARDILQELGRPQGKK